MNNNYNRYIRIYGFRFAVVGIEESINNLNFEKGLTMSSLFTVVILGIAFFVGIMIAKKVLK